jgi:hypothetical protein
VELGVSPAAAREEQPQAAAVQLGVSSAAAREKQPQAAVE